MVDSIERSFTLKVKRAPGGGRPKGSGKFGESTKVVRLPESVAQDVEGFFSRHQDLVNCIDCWLEELEPRKTSERVKLAYELVSELKHMLGEDK